MADPDYFARQAMEIAALEVAVKSPPTLETLMTAWEGPAPCRPCAEYQRGEREDLDFGGLPIHVCDWAPREGALMAVPVCPCGCKRGACHG